MEIQEFDIPAPWGHIAVKMWGNEKNTSILTIHGILDNAGSFDRLIMHLPQDYNYICFDLPGHGKSSHFPQHLPLYSINNIFVYKIVMDYFRKDKYIIMGHSYGGQIGLLYAQLYPEKVEKLIMLDTVHFYTVEAPLFGHYLRNKFDDHVALQEKLFQKKPPTYTYQEAVQRIITGRHYTLKEEAAKALVNRMLVPTGDNRFQFSMDQRLKNFINPIHDLRYAIESLKKHPVNCPILIILAKQDQRINIFFKSLVKYLQEQKNVVFKEVDGHHEVHNEDPQLVAPHIWKFLKTSSSKL